MAAYTFNLHQEFCRIRQKGFPIYTLTRDEMRDDLRSLLQYDRTGLIKEGDVGQTMHALGLAWHYRRKANAPLRMPT